MSLSDLQHQLAGETGALWRDLREARGYLEGTVDAADIFPALQSLRDTWGFQMLSDLSAVDYPGREPRFELLYNLYDISRGLRLILHVPVDEEKAEVASSVPLYKSANWYEREVWDMFGIRFRGHPELRRIFLYESFEGHPLRKDYPVNRRQPLIGPTEYIRSVGIDGGESLARLQNRLVVKRDLS